MAMTRPQPINVLFVASISAALHGGAAVIFAPAVSFLMLIGGAAPMQFKSAMAATNDGMLLAVLAPIAGAAFGFLAGAAAAIGHNMFAETQRKHVLQITEARQARAATASFSNVA